METITQYQNTKRVIFKAGRLDSSYPFGRCCVSFCYHHFYSYSPAQLVRGFVTLSDVLDKLWSLVPSLPPPRYVPSFLSRTGYSIPTFRLFMLVDLHRILAAHSHSRAFGLSTCKEESVVRFLNLRPPASIVTRLTIGAPGTPAPFFFLIPSVISRLFVSPSPSLDVFQARGH